MKKHLLFVLFQIKSAISTLPRLILCTLILSVVVISIGFFGTKTMNTDKKSISADVEVVLPKDDPELLMAYSVYSKMDSLASVARFHPGYDIESAVKALKEGKRCAVVIIPKGFIDGIMSGENIPATIILPKNEGIEASVFCSVIDAGVKSLAYVQSAIYAVSDIIINHNFGNEVLEEATEYLNDVNIEYALKRTSFYNHISISSTGKSSPAVFYFASAIVFLMALCGLAVTGIFGSNPPEVLNAMKTNRISKGFIRMSEYFSAVVIFLILFLCLAAGGAMILFGRGNCISFPTVMAYICVIFSVVAFVMFICLLGNSSLAGTLILFISSAFMVYAGGRILPSVFLPETVAKIGYFLPMKHWCDITEALGTGIIKKESVYFTLAYTAVFLLGSVALTYLRREKPE